MPGAKSVLQSILDTTFKLHFNFLPFALMWMVKLNLELQRQKPLIATNLKRVIDLFKGILKSYIGSDVFSSTELSAIKEDNPRNFKPLEKVYFGANVDAMIKNGIHIDPGELHGFKLKAVDC